MCKNDTGVDYDMFDVILKTRSLFYPLFLNSDYVTFFFLQKKSCQNSLITCNKMPIM